VLVRSVELWSALGGAATVRAVVAHATRARGVERLVEKTPQHLPWARHLAAAIPDARLLVITRHPIAAYASFRRRAAADPEASWADLSPETFASRWKADITHLSAAAAPLADRLRVERYEHLVANPREVQEGLFRWLGEATPASLPEEVAPPPEAPPSEAAQLFGSVRDLGHDWAAHVSRDEAERLERALAGPMSVLGYRPVAVPA
jgi:hypothetical protein